MTPTEKDKGLDDLKARPGEMIIMPAGVSHALKAVSRFKMLLVMIKK